MRFLIPDICLPNTYVHELSIALENLGHEVLWGGDNFFYSHWQPDAILSQWPGGYFRIGSPKNWQVSETKINQLEARLKEWKNKTLIIAFVHNTQSRNSQNSVKATLQKRLFTLNYQWSHAFIHLGKNSIKEFQEIYPKSVWENKPSLVISHGLYEQLREEYQSLEVKKDEESFRIFVPGSIRSWEEVSFVVRGFVKARVPNKKLVIAGSGPILSGRNPIKRLRRNLINSVPGVFIYGKYLNDELMCREIIKADVGISPRLWATNSGIPYLMGSFGKPCLAPKVGNIPEALEELNGIGFTPYDANSLAKSIKESYQKKQQTSPEIDCPYWQEIAQKIEQFILKFSNGS